MRDELDGRLWTNNHEEFSNGLDRLAGKVMDVFRQLNRHYWAAPWDRSEETGMRSYVIAAVGALFLSSIVITGAVAPAEVRAHVRVTTAFQPFYLA